ncbi:hypothetical protein D9M72_650580 [compost metagenome]
MPTIPSLQWTFTSISVCPSIVATDSLCGRMVGKSTSSVSIRSTTGAMLALGAMGAKILFMPRSCGSRGAPSNTICVGHDTFRI